LPKSRRAAQGAGGPRAGILKQTENVELQAVAAERARTNPVDNQLAEKVVSEEISGAVRRR